MKKKTTAQAIYLDFASATPISDLVYKTMKPYHKERFYNPSSLYRASQLVRNDIKTVRLSIANILGTQGSLVYFTDGATEANNLAILGSIRAWQKKNPQFRPHIITTPIEHASVLSVFKHLESTGEAEVTYLEVDKQGYLDLKMLKESLQENTILVSVGYVNGEIGTVQDLRAIMKIIRHHRKHQKTTYPLVHTDAVQAPNSISEIEMNKLGVDMMVINAAKIYGPKKIAVLALKSSLELEPLVYGGNQERKLRSGTENIAAIIGMAKALEETRNMHAREQVRLVELNNYFSEQLEKTFSDLYLNSPRDAAPHIVNVSFPDLSHEEIMLRLDAKGIMCSVKSACKAGEEGDSHVIMAIRKNQAGPTGSLRFSLGRTTTREEIEKVLKALGTIIKDMKQSYESYYSD